MSYVENNNKEQLEEEKKKKTKGLVRTILSEDTIVERPEDIIDKDPDVERRNAFKKAYEILLAIFPENIKKRNRKAKEKEEFDKSISYYRQNQIEKEKQKEVEEKEIDKDRGIERGE